MSMLKDFRDFAVKGNVIDLAVAVIIGGAFGKIVDSLVKDIIMPPIALVLGGIDFSSLQIVLKDTGNKDTIVAIRWGLFLQTLVQFFVIALVVFWIGKLVIREEPAAPTEPSDEVKLLTEIRDSLKR